MGGGVSQEPMLQSAVHLLHLLFHLFTDEIQIGNHTKQILRDITTVGLFVLFLPVPGWITVSHT